MSLFASNRQTLLIAALVALSLRALTPDGYMPGSAHSGLLYELCPDGMPGAIMQALAGDRHHHHHGGENGASVTGTEQCPIGHMLASVVAVDMGGQPDLVPDATALEDAPATILMRVSTTAYRSRAPPA
ncbi:MAG: hypothetical protein EX272_14725 [Chromatiales bacterium]|nr:MAG: hypothetical protein EX272_14725 [Chromatiales bacterium]